MGQVCSIFINIVTDANYDKAKQPILYVLLCYIIPVFS